jgi:hypothetical protein
VAPTPALPTFAANEVTTAAQLNAVGSNATNLYSYLQGGFRVRRPMVAVRVTKENREIVTNTDTRIGWDAVDFDTDNMWTGVVSEPLRINTAGWYRLGFQAMLQPITAAAGAILAARLAIWTSTLGARSLSAQAIAVSYGPGLSGVGSKANCSQVVYLPATYEVDFWVTHTLGATAALDNSFGGTRGYALWLGPG